MRFKLSVNDFFKLDWKLAGLSEVNEVKRILDLLREEPGSILSPDLDKVMTRQLSLRTKTCFPLHKAISDWSEDWVLTVSSQVLWKYLAPPFSIQTNVNALWKVLKSMLHVLSSASKLSTIAYRKLFNKTNQTSAQHLNVGSEQVTVYPLHYFLC